MNIKEPSTTNDFKELLNYFPNSNIRLLSEIENFHKKLATILHEEFSEAIFSTLQEINDISKEMAKTEDELNSLDIPLQVSEKTLKTYAQIQNEIYKLSKSNEYYEKTKQV